MGGTTLRKQGRRPGSPAHGPEPDPDPWDGPGIDGAAYIPLGKGRVRTVFVGLLPTLLLTALDQTVLAITLPDISGELHGPDTLSWPVTCYLLASAAGLPLFGRLADLFGRKAVFLIAVVVFLAGSALAGRAHSMDALIIFRAVQGTGAGGVLIGAQAIIAGVVPPQSRGRCMGLTGAAFGLALAAGPLAGGLCAERLSWRWGFYLNIPFGVLTVLLIAFALRLPKPLDRPKVDIVGALLLVAFFTFLALLASWGGTEYAWDSRVVLGLAAGTLGTALLFLAVEHFVSEPLFPLRLFRDAVFNVTGLVGAAVGLALFGAASYLPAFPRMTGGSTALASGLLMLPMTVGLVIASTVSGRIISRTGHYRVFPILGCAVAGEGMWLLSRMAEDTSREVHSLWTGILGLGIGFVLPVLVLAVRNSVRRAGPGAATTRRCFRQIGGTVGATLFVAFFANRLAGQSAPAPSVAGRPPAPESITPQLVDALPAAVRETFVAAQLLSMPRLFFYLVPVLVLGFLFALFLKENPLVSHASHAPQAPQTPHTPYGDPESPAAVPPARSAASAESAVASDAYAASPNPHGSTAAYSRPYGTTGQPPTPAGTPVCGTVQHHDGTTVPRAALTLIDVAGRQIGRGATGEDGRYALSTPGAGAYVLIAAAGGHQPQAVSVTVGERPVELDVVLGGAGRLAGVVTTADGTPVRDAMVTLTDVRGDVVATTRSGREGAYVIGDLVAGEYTLASSAPAFRPTALPVSVQASRETRQDIELAGGAVLRGTVRAGGGRPVEDARVTLLDVAGNVVDTATTGPDGLFRFVDLSAGEYTVIAAGYPPVATVLQVAGGGRTERDLQVGHED
ncbi:MFS transporter [Streptomyces halobius]|uniref:alpha-amylase n=1 Tax=Streptomyces halobius TaxID=2879846 RepID=A0ABY4M4Y9_9ACTN|nr:MFS transporter [Streptomyces halobius]UQA92248.1 MFS transporter [Streptomyces halobius]